MKFIIPLLMFFTSVRASEIKVLTWNVFMIPKPFYFSYQDERSKEIIKILKQENYDFVFLQEGFSRNFRKQIFSSLSSEYPHQTYLKKSKKPWNFINSGLIILSKFPFDVLETKYFKKCTHSDCLNSKGVILLQSNVRNEQIQFATTHLQAWDDKKAVSIRRSQLIEIKNLLQKHQKEGVNQVLLGDLNIDRNSTHEYPHILDLLEMNDLMIEGELNFTNGFKVGCYNHPGGPDNQFLDHIWFKSHGGNSTLSSLLIRNFSSVLGTKNCFLSDHFAVEAVVKL